jgi:hypothetical protein
VRTFVAGLVAGVLGLVLLVIEVAIALAGNALGTLGTVLLWIGVALVAVAGALFLLAVLSDSGVPADG